MIFTPEERRAALAVIFLLAVGELLALWQEWKDRQPDRDLSAWFARLDSLEIRPDSMAGRPLLELSLAGTSADSTRDDPPARPEAWPEAALDEAPPGILETGKLRINDATASALESLPGVGPALAERILRERDEGPYLEPGDLLRVKGIGPKKLAALEPWIDWTAPGNLHGARAKGATP